MQPERYTSPKNWRGSAASFAIHAIALLLLAGTLHRVKETVPSRLPGTREGVEYITYFSSGNTSLTRNDLPVKVPHTRQDLTSVSHSSISPKLPDTPEVSSGEHGIGNANQSGLGDGNLIIALPRYFPHPTPNLSALHPGTAGDVIFDAVIDENGKVTTLTLLQSLDPTIDDEVMQTVKQWIYQPALKNGVPVASVMEMHFHYERKG